MADNTELMSVREVARACGRSEETVRRWIWSGKLPAKKLGNQLFVERGDLEHMRAPRLAEPKAVYRAGARRGRGAEKLPFTPVKYDKEEALRQLDEAVAFGKMLREKYGPFDVTETLRQIREEDD